MLATDKLLTFGVNSVASTVFYYTLGTELSTKALQYTLGGVAVSTLFQAFYPDFASQMREKCGETFTKVATWIFPGVIPLAGYLGGSSLEINLFATIVFSPIQMVTSQALWLSADKRRSAVVKPIQKKVKEAIKDGCLTTAEEQMQKIETILRSRTDKGQGAWKERFALDDSKEKLSEALLNLSTPKTVEAEKWALAISSEGQKVRALTTLIQHLLKIEGNEEKVLELFEICRSLVKDPRDLFSLQLSVANRYNNSELLKDLKGKVSETQGSPFELGDLLSLIERGIALKSFEVPRHALNHVKQLIGHFVLDSSIWHDGYWHLTQRLKKLSHFPLPTHFATPESGTLYYLILYAVAMGDFSEAEQLLKHDRLSGEEKIAAHFELAYAYGCADEKKEKVQERLKEAEALIASHTFQVDVDDREAKEDAFAQRWREELFEIQLRASLTGAVETVKKLPHKRAEKYLLILEKTDLSHEILKLIEIKELSALQQLRFFKRLSEIDPESFFKVCQLLEKNPRVQPGHNDAFVMKEEMGRAKTILLLAKARLKRQEYDQADVLIKAINDHIDAVLVGELRERGLELRKKLHSLTSWPRVPAQRNWFSWAS